MRNKSNVLDNPVNFEQLKQYCDSPLPSRLLAASSCIDVTPPLPPGAFK
ncbi:MAG: hypothetical protein J0I84_21035 [Terrimonas sp.]|nr:hypothetical protein [Terrimonas sp.]